ncbi:MAG: hypothetical protein A2Y40_09560 [Candidatus Margulisbacteria bacterium GWF2_35_9]|nr:MAG: hypothetical protein A2Y40_09560 [Candidatus Margulisbacteria bacterium GWF2_35_9]
MNNYKKLIKHIESKVGLSLNEIKTNSPYETRKHLEKKNKKQVKFVSAFPFIGRGNVLRDGIKERSSINSEVDKILSAS